MHFLQVIQGVLDIDETQSLVDREQQAAKGFNRFSYWKDFFDFRESLVSTAQTKILQETWTVKVNSGAANS